MTKRIFRAILLVASAVLLACLLIIMGVLYNYFNTIETDRLTAQTEMAAKGVEANGAAYLASLDVQDTRLTWVQADGTVLYDSQADAATMENHSAREEIQEALQTGTGESARYSATMAQKTIYRAVRLSDGSVLRLSVDQYTVWSLALGMFQPILIVLVVAIVLAAIAANSIAKRIVKPLNALDLEQPLENKAYDELAPLLTRIDRQHAQIRLQMDELKRKQDEFAATTHNMREGLILLNETGTVVSINPAACAVFDTNTLAVGNDFLTVDRSRDIARAIDEAAQNGHSELRITRHGREQQLNISRIGEQAETIGTVLLIFDVTEQTLAERNRQEFTANVSHELKTPLQSIMGSAELIENGMVKEEDLPRFVGHIRREAARLVALINDIIRLSRLDEGGEYPYESVELLSLAEYTVETLSDAAAAKHVTCTVSGAPVTIDGVRRLMQEIVFNLCDNAIRYNREGGSVWVTVEENDQEAVLCVRDNGVGIAPEHQDRVFERFYRADKSHSKETGGTGLGLSIVKHAAKHLGAHIRLESVLDEGTSVTVTFPKTEPRTRVRKETL